MPCRPLDTLSANIRLVKRRRRQVDTLAVPASSSKPAEDSARPRSSSQRVAPRQTADTCDDFGNSDDTKEAQLGPEDDSSDEGHNMLDIFVDSDDDDTYDSIVLNETLLLPPQKDTPLESSVTCVSDSASKKGTASELIRVGPQPKREYPFIWTAPLLVAQSSIYRRVRANLLRTDSKLPGAEDIQQREHD